MVPFARRTGVDAAVVEALARPAGPPGRARAAARRCPAPAPRPAAAPRSRPGCGSRRTTESIPPSASRCDSSRPAGPRRRSRPAVRERSATKSRGAARPRPALERLGRDVALHGHPLHRGNPSMFAEPPSRAPAPESFTPPNGLFGLVVDGLVVDVHDAGRDPPAISRPRITSVVRMPSDSPYCCPRPAWPPPRRSRPDHRGHRPEHLVGVRRLRGHVGQHVGR